MRLRSSRAVATALPVLCALTSVFAQTSGLKPLVYKGCFTASSSMTDLGSFTYQAPGYCQKQCVDQNKPVMANWQGSNCLCGDLLPDPSSKVAESACNSKCNGYGQDMCGGPNAWSVQLTGINNNVGSQRKETSSTTTNSNSNSDSNSNSNSNVASDSNTNSNSNAEAVAESSPPASQPTPTQKGPPSVVTKASTIVVTAPGQTNAKETIVTTTHTPPPSKGPNKAGIAAGVVVGLVALSALAGGVFLFLRNRKKRAVEEEYRRNLADSYGPKPPTSSAGSTSDSRLEPSVMMQRRQSDGSIADNQDYSRRILKITNPDGT